ncbi:hypothetical protein PSAB6_30253 [Paraburkholderia sabiae]|nr:hypothetical protein PSAB6_30253 [Paraburkholderia sabiae]
MNVQTSERLRDGHQLDRVDVDVRGARRDPVDRIGDVFGRERLDVLIDVRSLLVVAAETHVRKLGAPAQPRLDVRHADGRAVQIRAQVQAELAHERLGRAVHVAARIRPRGRYRAQIEHMPAIALDHARQKRARDLHETRAVGLDHRGPVIEHGTLRGLEPEREAGVVDEHVDSGKVGGQRGGDGFDGGAVAHVELERQQVVAEFVGERLQTILAARGGDDAMAAFDESPGDSGAEPCGRAGDEHDHCCSLVGEERPQAYFQCGDAARMTPPREGTFEGTFEGTLEWASRRPLRRHDGAADGLRRALAGLVAYSTRFQ